MYCKEENEYHVYITGCSAIVFFEQGGGFVVEFRQFSRKENEDGEHDFVYSLRYDDGNRLIDGNPDFWKLCQWEFDMRGF